MRRFGAALAALALCRIVVGFVAVPAGWLAVASVVSTLAFMALPILALFAGAAHRWDLGQAIALVVLGVVLHIGSRALVGAAAEPAAKGVLDAIAQSGLVVWCLGVGAALACLLQDRNMLLPIAAFLALFDVWLVFAPEGLVSRALRGAPAPIDLQTVAYRIPSFSVQNAPAAEAANGFAKDLAYVGPADLLFLAMFFVALYRFDMRARETFRAVVPVLLAYLAVVLLFPDVWLGPIRLAALPALLPIGVTVLWTNRREFRLSAEERTITLGLLLVGIPFVAWRILATSAGEEPPGEADWNPPFQPTVEDLQKTYRF